MNDTPQLKTYDMGDGIVAFSTTRHGGVSTDTSYASFNINPFCGDDPAHVAANRELLCKELGIDSRHLILPTRPTVWTRASSATSSAPFPTTCARWFLRASMP